MGKDVEAEEITALVDGIYKNILEKFNPGTRQMINAGKAYLKALHGASAASRVYVDAITKLARQAQQTTWSGCSDIGAALMQIVEVYRDTQSQQMNILKAFYVDVLIPLETNLEKDTKVIQSDQKKFLQNHKQHIESYEKAESLVKKYRKKQNGKHNTSAMDKELKSLQLLEDEKNKLDAFCERSLKNAMLQERRRYGFVLERQCSLGKHMLVFHSNQHEALNEHITVWSDLAKAREQLPEAVSAMFSSHSRESKYWLETEERNMLENGHAEDDCVSVHSHLRKTISMDAHAQSSQQLSVATDINNEIKKHPLLKAKSEYNVSASTMSLHKVPEEFSTLKRPSSIAIGNGGSEKTTLVRALYSYLSNGENQLSFLEGDVISVIGELTKGWQYGENLRTQCQGWFPLNYTDVVIDDDALLNSPRQNRREIGSNGTLMNLDKHSKYSTSPPKMATKKFGDSVANRPQMRRPKNGSYNIVPAPVVPAPVAPNTTRNHTPVQGGVTGTGKNHTGNASLHSSNDSGFSNDPPIAPDVDYSDEDTNGHSSAPGKKILDMSQDSPPPAKIKSSINDWLNHDNGRNSPMRHSSSVGHLLTLERTRSNYQRNNADIQAAEKRLKRAKSLWKFKKTEDVLEGMSLWKHRSLVDINARETDALMKPYKNTPVFEKKINLTREISLDDSDDNETIINGVGIDVKEKRNDVSTTSMVDEDGAIRRGDNDETKTDKRYRRHEVVSERRSDDFTLFNGGRSGIDVKRRNYSSSNGVERSPIDGNRFVDNYAASKSFADSANDVRRHKDIARSFVDVRRHDDNFTMSAPNGNQKQRQSYKSDDEPSDPESCIVVDDHRRNTSSSLPRTRYNSNNNCNNNNDASMTTKNNVDSQFDDGDSDDIVFESSKLQAFKYNNRLNESSWYDSWGERKKK